MAYSMKHVVAYLVILSSFLLWTVHAKTEDNLGRGFGDDIKWKTLEDGYLESKTSGKPLMLLIHKTWCGACKALKPRFAESQTIKDMSEKFVMVNVEDDEEPGDKKYSPDGGYIPRILFFDSDGNFRDDIYNESGNPSYKYFYPEPNAIVKSMTRAMEAKKSAPQGADEL